MRLIGTVLLCILCLRAWCAAPAEPLSEFDIRAQPLPGALLEFSGQSGIQVLAADARLVRRRVRSVQGRMSATTALRRLLEGTGLSFRSIDAGTIVLLRDPAQGAAPGSRADAASSDGPTEPDGSPAGSPALTEMDEVRVTGTRIQIPGNYTAATPMTTITGEEMRRLGIVNVADAITTLVPQNNSHWQPLLTGEDQDGTIGRSSFFIGNTITNLRGLDPMFGSRTLTIIDGRRVVSTSNQADVVDMNVIPSALLQRMDVVTGGASATYGSGAIAGVVNLVLDRRMTGVNVDLDYGINEAGDGASPHAAISAGTTLFGGRGHALLGIEWQNVAAIRDCAAARRWCAASRTLYENFSDETGDPSAPLMPLPGLAGYPARFLMTGVRFSQFAPTGTIYSNSADNSSGYRFSADGRGIEEYAFGFRGGDGTGGTSDGDGPLVTTGRTMRPSTERRLVFTNLEYELGGGATAYVQSSYARTDSLNRNRFTQGTACLRFNTPGIDAVPGGTASAGDFIAYGGNGEAFTDPFTGAAIADFPRNPLWSNANFRLALGNAPTGRVPPYFIRPGQNGSTDTTPPVWNFTNGVNPVWQRIKSAQGTDYWNLVGVTITFDFTNPGTPAVLPTLGRNAYAFLGQLNPEALYQVQRAFGNSSVAGGGPGLDALFGPTPCSGFTALRKVWNPQVQQWTSHESETLRTVVGMRGGLAGDWRWDAYYQYGQTQSISRQNSVQTNLSFAFAMDAVIDDRATSPTFGQPICRIVRDGIPLLDYLGRPLSDPEGLAQLASGCRPLNILGTQFATPAAAQRQREALDYAFKDNVSAGDNSLHTLSLSTSGSLWQGWAGPLTGAFGLEIREDTVDNQGSRGPYYLRADIVRAWGDAFGGSTRVTEGYSELDLPLVNGAAAINLLSVNAGVRYAAYHNRGGAGTTGQSATQATTNWKLSAVYEPFRWARFRVTRSRDLRAAGYRELFLNQPSVPDNASGINPWRDRTADSTENQRERWGNVQVGNPDLRPERSDTLTMGLVLSPGGWAQGMRLSADYYSIRVREGIYSSYSFVNPIAACWEKSGNQPARYVDGAPDPQQPGVNGQFDPDVAECREIAFATHEDGSRNLQDIVTFNANRPANGLPYQRRGIDMAWNYGFPLSRALERVPGTLSLTVRATRALESSGIQHTCVRNSAFQCTDAFTAVDLVGQIRSSAFIPGVLASPKWTGNIMGSYRMGALTASLSARYTGGAKLDRRWSDDPGDPGYSNASGQLLEGSVDNNRVPPYVNFSLNGAYDLHVAQLSQFQVFGSINNLFDRSPPFAGGTLSGANAQFHDTLGRAYRMGVRLKF